MKIAKIVFFSASMLAAGGCAAQKKSADFFTPKQDQAHWNAIAEQQEIAAAVRDPSLYERDFTCAHLNSLGRKQLDLIRKGNGPGEKINIYVERDADSDARRSAIRKYFSGREVPADDLKIIIGTNPDSGTRASRNLNELNKLNSVMSATSSENISVASTPK